MIETVTAKKTNNQTEDGITGQMMKFDHEEVLFCNDNATGLRAIIAIHNTVLGPGLGGCRIWKYTNEAEALNDVLRLSRGMTYKSSVAGLNLGGAKAVIIGDSKTIKSEALMRRFGRFIDDLGGKCRLSLGGVHRFKSARNPAGRIAEACPGRIERFRRLLSVRDQRRDAEARRLVPCHGAGPGNTFFRRTFGRPRSH